MTAPLSGRVVVFSSKRKQHSQFCYPWLIFVVKNLGIENLTLRCEEYAIRLEFYKEKHLLLYT